MNLGKNISAKFHKQLNFGWHIVYKYVEGNILESTYSSIEIEVEEIIYWLICNDIDDQISVYDLD